MRTNQDQSQGTKHMDDQLEILLFQCIKIIFKQTSNFTTGMVLLNTRNNFAILDKMDITFATSLT